MANEPKNVKGYELQNLLISLIVALFLLVIYAICMFTLKFSMLESAILVLVSIVVYIFLIFFLLQYSPSQTKKMQKEELAGGGYIGTSEGKRLAMDIEEAIGKPREKLPSLDRDVYVGSIKSKKYHLRGCRLAKLIKQEDKLSNDNPLFFKRRNFKPCKVCLKKQKA